ncbi:uncharacterized protein LOC141911413 isoform X2 [Tubulanus polymorphus]|uniref:uncharacterized protein LOC141911413 isoform X2 n=1 Tax=Tubulanus polymorphus TaxID=672921 RepID=UPI003DA2016E
MAAAYRSGQTSPTNFHRTIDSLLDEAQHTGEVNLTARNLKEYPKLAKKYGLEDTRITDLSKNRLTEIPFELCDYHSMERLSCYNNVIRIIPEAVITLQSLTYINLSRNQLSHIPPFVCQLQSLEVLLINNNKLVSLPEEISRLENLTECDVSCNEITHLPSQIGDCRSLQVLNIRRNLLVEIPPEISKLKLRKLDFSCNRISVLPTEMCKLEQLDELITDYNPLMSPPAQICTKGRVHIMKYLQMEAIKEDRKRGVLSDCDVRRHFRKSASVHTVPDDFRTHLINSLENHTSSPGETRKKRHTTDSGYTTDPSETQAPHLVDENQTLKAGDTARTLRGQQPQRPMFIVGTPVSEPATPARKVSNPTPGTDRRPIAQSRSANSTPGMDRRSSAPAPSITDNPKTPSSPASSSSSSYATPSPSAEAMDAFTRELQRQKAEYEARKTRAEQIRREKEEEEEKDERRRLAQKLQDEQKALIERQLAKKDPSTNRKIRHLLRSSQSYDETVINSYQPPPSTLAAQVQQQQKSLQKQSAEQEKESPKRHLVSGGSVKDDKTRTNNNYRRTSSDGSPGGAHVKNNGLPETEELQVNGRNSVASNGSVSSQQAVPLHGSTNIPINHLTSLPPEEEFRHRHELIRTQHIHEAGLVQKRIEDEKNRMYRLHKESVYSYLSKKTVKDTTSTQGREVERTANSGSVSEDIPASPKSLNDNKGQSQNDAQISSTISSHIKPRSAFTATPPKSLANFNPNFTIRRHLDQACNDMELMENLRKDIEARLKVSLPEDLPSALKDGVVLCHLANHIRPRSVSSIHVPSPAVPNLSMAKCRRNVENFLEACRKIGVDKECVCACDDIMDGNGRIVNTVSQLLLYPRLTYRDYLVSYMCVLIFVATTIYLAYNASPD